MTDTDRKIAAALAALKRPLRLTRAGMLAERLTRAFWPVWSLIFALIAVLAFGVPQALPLEAVWIGTLAWLAGLIWALVAGVRRFRWPRMSEALSRLDATLPGRPIAALADRQAIGATDGESSEVWRIHLDRMAQRAAMARAPDPDLKLNARDPFALRYVALVALVMALMFGSLWRVTEVAELAPAPLRFEAQAAQSAWEAWIQPPTYTGRPSLYLNEVDRPNLSVPEGSRVTVRLYGQTGTLTLAESVSGREALPEEAGAPAHDFEVSQAGRIAVQGPGGRSWEVTVQADQPPRVRLDGPMTREAGGTLRQAFEASDDYGVVAGEAELALDLDRVDRRHGLAAEPEPREPIRLDLPMPIAGDRAQFTEALIDDLSQHPWANLPVTVRLTVTDARDQQGHSETREVTLPGRRFFDPVASAVIELRRDLLWTLDAGPRVSQLLRAISHRPEDGVFRSERAYLLLRSTMRQLDAALTDGLQPEARDEIAEALWDLAVLIEDGDLADAAERLRRAQERLSEAMRRGADQSEIEELMAELREAMRDYINQLAQQQPEEGEQQRAEGESQEITGDQLQDLMDRIQELMEEGRMAEAMELLEMLRQMMENLQVTQGEGGEGSPGQQALDGLGEALRDQQGLSDDTFRDLQNQFGQQRGQQSGQQPGQQPGEGEGEDGDAGEGEGGTGEGGADGPGGGSELADRQRALRDMIRQFDDMDLPGDGTDGGDATRQSLDEAGRAMERAEEALREGDGTSALDRQAEAIDALRDSMRGLADSLAQEQGEGGDTDSAALGEGGTDRAQDPLGRDVGRTGRLGSDEQMLQGEDVYRRAQELLDEIRRRSGEQDRPEMERDYLRRLLERF